MRIRECSRMSYNSYNDLRHGIISSQHSIPLLGDAIFLSYQWTDYELAHSALTLPHTLPYDDPVAIFTMITVSSFIGGLFVFLIIVGHISSTISGK